MINLQQLEVMLQAARLLAHTWLHAYVSCAYIVASKTGVVP